MVGLSHDGREAMKRKGCSFIAEGGQGELVQSAAHMAASLMIASARGMSVAAVGTGWLA